MKRILFILPLFLAAGCNNGSLLAPSESLAPVEGKLFAQILLQTTQNLSEGFLGGKDGTNDIEDVYEIRIDEISAVVGHVSFETEIAAAGLFKAHDVDSHEEHAEPTSCDYEGSFSSSETVDLKETAALPCFVLDEGIYAGVKATVGSIAITGTALKDGIATPFAIHDLGEREIVVAAEAPLALNAEVHHIAFRIDLKTWFHGVDFSQLEAVDGVVLFDETHNAHRYEHMVNDHVPESLSLALAD